MLNYQLPDSNAEACQAAIESFRRVAADFRRAAIESARALVEVQRLGAHFREGASSLADFAERNGMSGWEARRLASLGAALAEAPALATDIEKGTIPVESGALLGEVAREGEAFQRPGDRWIEWARSMPTRNLRHLVQKRRDETRAAEEVTLVTAYVTHPVREDMNRACELTSRQAHVRLTLGQTIGTVFKDWLADHDPLRTTQGTRRLPDTATIPDSRTVPAEVDRQVRRRSGDRCIVPFCDNGIWVHRSHRVPHQDGGSREADGLDLLCDYHHLLYEKGLIRITGPTDAPVVVDSRGRPMDARIPFEQVTEAAEMEAAVPPTANQPPGSGVLGTLPPDVQAIDSLPAPKGDRACPEKREPTPPADTGVHGAALLDERGAVPGTEELRSRREKPPTQKPTRPIKRPWESGP